MSIHLQNDLISFKDLDEDFEIEIEMSTGDGWCRVYLSIDEIKEVIKYLQHQISE